MNQAKSQINVLVLDDDPVYRNLLRSILKEKVTVFAAEAPSLAFRILANEKIEILICDFKLPEMDGLRVLEKVKSEYPDISVIMISSAGNMDTVITALRNGASDFLKKPLSAPEVWVSIERTRKLTELTNDLSRTKKKNILLDATMKEELGNMIIGSSPGIELVRKQMKMVAQAPDTSVLVVGESGTGKELVARGIHEMSSRKDELFCAVNMSAVPESLFESEFFGHKKGSFTGAISDRAGWFETANGGTLFFDEIGEMTMALQVKLLRVIEDRRFTRVGGQSEQKFDIRIIAATNKNTEELSSGKNFRVDLYHRLGTFIIEIPPLRERVSDIGDITDHYLRLNNRKLGKHVKTIDKSALKLLTDYPFPGNIRELKNIIERAVIICDGDKIMPEHVLPSSPSARAGREDRRTDTFNLEVIEKETIIRALEKVNYNKAEAARLLNIEWNALYRRIQKHDIKIPD
ncbi:MAG: sigma-54 dependent transcriptional regulator [Bacteroidales bacterium]